MNKKPQSQSWITLNISVPVEMADAVINFLHEWGSGGVVLDDTDPEETRITAYFSVEEWDAVWGQFRKYLNALRDVFPDLPAPAVETTPLQNENWALTWKAHFKSVKVGKRLIITPPWLKPRSRTREVVVIEPAEAFGTGTHETTRSCLVFLEAALEESRKGNEALTFLDVGCGSGILGIAAIKLGAGPVLAVDNDPVAVQAAAKNALLNQVEDRLQFKCAPVKDLTGQFDVVAANLDPMTLTANRAKLIALTGRYLIVAGVPLDQWDGIRGLFVSHNLVLTREITESEWGAGRFGKGRQS
ncbi:MAG: 50S ribosomal protein L11 methyltransferase [Desulfomonilaceae bacterium]